MNIDLVTVKCLLKQLNNIMANSTRAIEPFSPSEQHAGIDGGLGDREGEGEAELEGVRVGRVFDNLRIDVLAGDELLDRDGDKVHQLRDVRFLEVIGYLEGR